MWCQIWRCRIRLLARCVDPRLLLRRISSAFFCEFPLMSDTPPQPQPLSRRRLGVGLAGGLTALAAACSPLTAFNTLAPRDPARRVGRDLAYGADPMQSLDIYAPEGGATGLPVAVFFYGGGWDSGRRQDYGFVGQALASRGFLTVVAGYRLVPQVRYPAFVEDAAAAIAWCLGHVQAFGGDPGRLVLVGHSAGAYNALQVALDPTFLRQVGVDPARVRAVAGLSGPYDFLPLDVAATKAAFGGYRDLPDTQPINHVRPGAPPIFLGHGSKDTLVWPRNSVRLAKALTQAGDTVELKIYPGLDHPDTVLALSRPFRGKAPILAEMTDFLMDHAGP